MYDRSNIPALLMSHAIGRRSLSEFIPYSVVESDSEEIEHIASDPSVSSGNFDSPADTITDFLDHTEENNPDDLASTAETMESESKTETQTESQTETETVSETETETELSDLEETPALEESIISDNMSADELIADPLMESDTAILLQSIDSQIQILNVTLSGIFFILLFDILVNYSKRIVRKFMTGRST